MKNIESRESQERSSVEPGTGKVEFRYTIDRFADLKVMRYQVPGWNGLSVRQRLLLYYLSEAANCGRDILYAQNFKYGLLVKRVLESIYRTYSGNRDSENFCAFVVFLKRVWFSNGVHHHYACDKFEPGFSRDYFIHLMEASDMEPVLAQIAELPDTLAYEENGIRLAGIRSKAELAEFLTPVLFDASLYAKRINLDPVLGLLEASACNYYQGVSTKEAEAFYSHQRSAYEQAHPEAVRHPLSYGLNTRLVKAEGKLEERVCRVGGLYSKALEKVVDCLEKAAEVSENESQRKHILKLVDYYRSGSLAEWDDYSICWVEDTDSRVDYTNGFIETYGDPLGLKASWEAIADFRDEEASRRTEIICRNAQWFEDHSPVDARFKKAEVKGVSAKVINVVQLGGDCFPSSPIGINLPNADWIRHEHGSKSVTIENLTDAYDKSAKEGPGMLSEFAFDESEVERSRQYSTLGGNLHTDLHECLGHGSGRLLDGVASDALKNYASTLEEARADLFALYYLADPKMEELGLVSTPEIYKSEYDSYIRNGLMTQLVRIELGKDIEEAHMRNRSMIAHWVYEKGASEQVIEKLVRDGKTYFRIRDYEALRALFASLLAEVQRIKSEGDYEAGKAMVERYGVKVDADLHREVLDRYRALGLAAYGGFVNPKLSPVYAEDGRIRDVEIRYPDDFAAQMMDYADRYSFLPIAE